MTRDIDKRTIHRSGVHNGCGGIEKACRRVDHLKAIHLDDRALQFDVDVGELDAKERR